MADDIVTDVEGLRLIAWSLEGGNVKMADECRRAADEIERLRAAGDALVGALENNLMATAVVLVNQWKEARRG